MPKPDSRELRTMAQAMAQLSCSRGMIEKFWREGRLERVRFGGQTRITARSLDALFEVLASDSLKPKQERGR